MPPGSPRFRSSRGWAGWWPPSLAERGGRQSRRQTAPVREPLERVADADAVHDARTATAKELRDVQERERGGVGVDDPREGGESPAGDHQPPRTETLGEVTMQRHQQCLRQDEVEIKPFVDVHLAPAVRSLHRMHEQRPGVLEIGDRHHGDDAGGELNPAMVQARRWTDRQIGLCSHRLFRVYRGRRCQRRRLHRRRWQRRPR